MVGIAVPPIIVFLRHHKRAIDWQMVIAGLCLYAIAFVMYFLIHVVRTAKKLDAALLADLAAAHATIEELTPKPNLHGDTQNLSTAILDFFFERAKAAPPQPVNRTKYLGGDFMQQVREYDEWSAQRGAHTAYETETLQIYDYRFSRDVRRIVERFRAAGLTDEAMEPFWETPGVAQNIRAVGERLRKLTEEAPESA
jgi:hypothetical protein